MSRFDPIYCVLDDSVRLYTDMLSFEQSKYAVIVHRDTPQLEEMLKVEQAFIMKAGGLEKSRDSLQSELGFDGCTLSEMAANIDEENCGRLLGYREQLLKLLYDIKAINTKSAQIIETRLKNTEKRLEMSGYIQEMHTYDNTGTVAESISGMNQTLIAKTV